MPDPPNVCKPALGPANLGSDLRNISCDGKISANVCGRSVLYVVSFLVLSLIDDEPPLASETSSVLGTEVQFHLDVGGFP